MRSIKGYKASYNGACKGFLYEVGKTYTHEGKLQLHSSGFHYYTEPHEVFRNYQYKEGVTKFFEIEDLSVNTIDDGVLSVTDKLKIVREIPFEEYKKLFFWERDIARFKARVGYDNKC